MRTPSEWEALRTQKTVQTALTTTLDNAPIITSARGGALNIAVNTGAPTEVPTNEEGHPLEFWCPGMAVGSAPIKP